ncbi:MAG: hypothetical protein PWR19_313 [Carnobacterium sp.]|uniref:hypothetical protein n=1 Tax=Carnobacterium sp. TaxID=48221 RepID=UPI0026486221|nr:hypothetical protein [Carnobacterium sp.]MDN5371267.1 hypothetical protein [Carnobacterium sp.]
MNKSYGFTTKREVIENARHKARVSTTNEELIYQLNEEINEKDAYIAELEETLIEMSDRNAVMA